MFGISHHTPLCLNFCPLLQVCRHWQNHCNTRLQRDNRFQCYAHTQSYTYMYTQVTYFCIIELCVADTWLFLLVVEKVTIHSGYNVSAKTNKGIPEFYDYDVALIKLKEAVKVSAMTRLVLSSHFLKSWILSKWTIELARRTLLTEQKHW